MTAPIHMVRLALRTDRIVERGHRLRLPLREIDLGYLVHVQLTSLFGDLAPAPFAIEVDARARPSEARPGTNVLGYAHADRAALEAHARTFAEPQDWESCNWTTASSKPMPELFEPGQRLGFEVRACPIVRSKTERHPDGREVDAFLAECLRVGPDQQVDREQIYLAWLGRELARGGASSLEHAELVRFKRERLLRRTQGSDRKAHSLERPDATLVGRLKVDDPAAFAELLARGIGRHRAFGFGMVLLRPLRSS